MKKLFLVFLIVPLILVSCSSSDAGLIADFESETISGWEITGDFSNKIFNKSLLPHYVKGFLGKGLIDTGFEKPEKKGTLVSPEFIITKKYINFLVTGNNRYNAERDCNVRLIIDGKVAKYAPPTRYPVVEWGAMEVSEFIGKKGRFEIYDMSKKYFILIDQIYQSDTLALGVDRMASIVDKKYLIFPVTKGGNQNRFRLRKNGDLDEQFVIEMGDGEPDYWAFKDLSNFQGKEIELFSYSPNVNNTFNKIILSDNVPGEDRYYKEKERPQFHFTSKTGFINDPNGLVYSNGVWNLMYQHNPYGIIGSLKHWGHATSKDLIHWTENPSSISPDDLGSNHSGGAVVDFNNSAGLQTSDYKTLIAFWTSAGHFTTPSSRFQQCISYSTNDGKTWQKYSGNPIITHIVGRNRDPNVIWHEEAQKWIMSLFLDNQEFAIFNSKNLFDWKLTDRIKMPANDCPDLFQLNLDGDPKNRKWIFWGGNGNYVVGSFDGEKFDIEGEVHRTHFGTYHAAMTYNNAPDNRIVQIGWLNTQKTSKPTTNFNQQLSISNEILLKTTPKGYPALYSYPIKELEKLREKSFHEKNISLGKKIYKPDFKAELIDLNLIANVNRGGLLTINIRGEKILYDRDKNKVIYNGHGVELITQKDTQEFRILVDRASVEIFCNGGEIALFESVVVDPNKKFIEFSTNDTKSKIKQLNIYSLKSAWK